MLYKVIDEHLVFKPTAKVLWLGKAPQVSHFTKSKKGNHWEMSSLVFQSKKTTADINVSQPEGKWLVDMLEKLSINNTTILTLQQVKR